MCLLAPEQAGVWLARGVWHSRVYLSQETGGDGDAHGTCYVADGGRVVDHHHCLAVAGSGGVQGPGVRERKKRK